ncbi:MAG: AAA family ATPase [Ardenticatenaceae bacterium]|nr:AAA family ATPase [Ardenticatenaceae bacterium]
MSIVDRLPAKALYHYCNPEQFTFTTTADLDDLTEIIGQPRALEAIRLGIGIQHEGFNLFVQGPNGVGKHTAVLQYLQQKAVNEPIPDDWCYVHNFEHPHKPQTLRLPAGSAVALQSDMQQLVKGLSTVIPSAFASSEYEAQKKAIETEIKAQHDEALNELKKQARGYDIALIQTPTGFAFAPLKDGEVMNPEEFMRFSTEKQQAVEDHIKILQEELQAIMRMIPHWQREHTKRVRQLNEEIAEFAIAPLFHELHQKYESLDNVLAYLTTVQKDVIEHVDDFIDAEEDTPSNTLGITSTKPAQPSFGRYQINIFIDHSRSQGAPVVYEDQPSYNNLIGRIEHISQMGTLLTDFTLIKPGAMHRANGGYLMLEARKVLMQPYAWEGLKHALRARQVRIESLGQMVSIISTVSLEPEPIPLDVKVVLIGERQLYYLLYEFDPDFSELFKVTADFEDQMPRDDANNLIYARLIATLARKEKLLHFDRYAVAKVIEFSARLSGAADKLSTHMQSISDLLRESSFWAEDAGRSSIQAADVLQAREAQTYRVSRVRDRLQETILRQTVLIDTDGGVVGQINGLAVYGMGHFTFGRPNRITANICLGKGEVIDIERQVELGGPIHSKGVMILSGFLGARFARERPLSLSASLVFEQSYGGVDGDSASSAELYALLSALADLPIKQSLAVTGSVNQHGRVQAIGGVNEKIEGFFDLCQARGLTGEQGVLIPSANVKHLMLREDVVTAVSQNQFHIYPIDHIDQGIEILTGVPAGQPNGTGKYEEGSVNGRVEARLTQMAEAQREKCLAHDPTQN